MIEFDYKRLVGDDDLVHHDPDKLVYSIKFSAADDVLVLMHHPQDSSGVRCWTTVEAGEFDPSCYLDKSAYSHDHNTVLSHYDLIADRIANAFGLDKARAVRPLPDEWQSELMVSNHVD